MLIRGRSRIAVQILSKFYSVMLLPISHDQGFLGIVSSSRYLNSARSRRQSDCKLVCLQPTEQRKDKPRMSAKQKRELKKQQRKQPTSDDGQQLPESTDQISGGKNKVSLIVVVIAHLRSVSSRIASFQVAYTLTNKNHRWFTFSFRIVFFCFLSRQSNSQLKRNLCLYFLKSHYVCDDEIMIVLPYQQHI